MAGDTRNANISGPGMDRSDEVSRDSQQLESGLEPKHKIFLSHSGVQKSFVEALCVQLEAIHRFPFFDQRTDCLPWGERFPNAIFQAAQQCRVAVVVLSEDFFTSKWPMLELVAFMQQKESGIKILPLFFKTSLSELRDPTRQSRWFSSWEGWAQADPRIKLEEWKDAFKQLPSFKGIEYVKQGSAESSNQESDSLKAYRDKVVEALCELVPPDVWWLNARDVQGRLRICQEILAKFERTGGSASPIYGVRVVGLYGMGGIGKTTFCKALCNELETRFVGKVCHVELGNHTSELELLQDLRLVIRSLTDTEDIRGIDHWTQSQCRDYLHREVRRKATFLALDNVSPESLKQAIVYLQLGFHEKSMVLVTARSLSILTSHLKIDERECMEMPNLDKEEATRLFLKHAALDYHSDSGSKPDDHDSIVQVCVKECLYSKGDKRDGHHYHPLALLVLGEQLRSWDPSEWLDIVDKEPDKFNLLGETTHPVFNVLERSYKSLSEADRLLFMDVALFTPEKYILLGIPRNIFCWLSMVHNLNSTQVRIRLELLKTRGMLEDLGDGSRSIGMHDLFRELAQMEAKAVDLDTQTCVYATHDILELQKTRSGNCCPNLARIGLARSDNDLESDDDVEKFAGIQWNYFSNVVVLKLFGCDLRSEDLDLTGLKLLRSLDVYDCWSLTELPGLQELKRLTYLRLVDVPVNNKTLNQLPVSLKYLYLQDLENLYSPPNLDHCTNLLELTIQLCPELYNFPDLSKLSSLQKISFSDCYEARTVRGLSSHLYDLQSLRVVGSTGMRVNCPDLGEMTGLQTLQLLHTDAKELPDFQKFTNLKQMEILGNQFTRLSGLESLPKLAVIILKGCSDLRSLENVRQLPALRVLHVGGCHNLRSLKVYDCVNLSICLGLSDLTALEELHLSNVGVQEIPDLKELYLRNVGRPLSAEPQGEPNFARLKILNLHGCTELKSLEEMGPLPALQQLDLSCCSKLEELPDLSSSHELELLDFSQTAVQLRYRDVYKFASMPLLSPISIAEESPELASQKRKQKMPERKFFGMDYETFFKMNTLFMSMRVTGSGFNEAEGYYLMMRNMASQGFAELAAE